MFDDPWLQVARRLDVVDDRRARRACQHVGGEQHQLPVGIDDVAGRRHDAEPVAVAVEREAELAVALRKPAPQILEVLRLGRIRMMIGEIAVDVAEELDDVAAEAPIELGCERAGDAVAAVDRDAHRTRELDVADDSVDDSADTVEGREQHQRVHAGWPLPGPEQSQDDFQTRAVMLSSDTHRIIAKLDVLDVEGGLVTPVDYNTGGRC